MSTSRSKKQRTAHSNVAVEGVPDFLPPEGGAAGGLFLNSAPAGSDAQQRALDAPALGPILQQVSGPNPNNQLAVVPPVADGSANPSALSSALQQYSGASGSQPPADSSVGIQSFPLQGPLIPVPVGQRYVDITDYLNMPQTKAAEKLGLPTSTLSKRWKEAVCNRKWPFRAVQKLDKEITTLLYNVPTGDGAPPLPKEIEDALARLLRKREEELRSVVVRI